MKINAVPKSTETKAKDPPKRTKEKPRGSINDTVKSKKPPVLHDPNTINSKHIQNTLMHQYYLPVTV